MARIYVTPRAGLSPRDPLQPDKRIPPEGDWREEADVVAYQRLANAGDLTISDGPAPSEPAPKAKK